MPRHSPPLNSDPSRLHHPSQATTSGLSRCRLQLRKCLLAAVFGTGSIRFSDSNAAKIGHGPLSLAAYRSARRASAARASAICAILDRKSVVSGTSVSVRVDLGGRRIMKKKTYIYTVHWYYIDTSHHNHA